MSSLEKDMINILKELKEKYHIIGVKLEFETECLTLKEGLNLKKLTDQTGLMLSIKTGGGSSLKDLYEAKSLGAHIIVAPMIESVYALKKYIENIKKIFTETEMQSIKFFINIETITGFNALKDILESKYSEYISGIVFGRTDMIASLNLAEEDINNDEILEYAKTVADYAKKYNKEFSLGGKIWPLALPFLKKIPQECLDKFETRKIIFDSELLDNKDADIALLKAIQFELMWIVNRRYNLGISIPEDDVRAKVLENYVNNTLQSANS